MTEILQESDFTLKVSFIDIRGRSLEVKSFNFTYSTHFSPAITATYDGQNYSSNCKPTADGVIIIFDNPKFNVGQLKVQRKYSVACSLYENGVKEVTQTTNLPIMIVEDYSQPTESFTPIMINPISDDLICLETSIGEGIVGKQGVPGKSGNDYATAIETQTDEYWEDAYGVKRRVYYKTITGSSPAKFILNAVDGEYRWFWNIPVGGELADFQIVRCKIGNAEQFHAQYGLMFTSTLGWGSSGVALWFKKESDAALNSQPIVLTIKYTKA